MLLSVSVYPLLFLSTFIGVSCEELTPVKNEEYSLEGGTVILSYKYSKTATGSDEFYWYRQDPGKPPQFLISHSGSGSVLLKADPNSGLSVNVTKEKTQMDLEISSAAVTDSAVYYCALLTTGGYNKMLFGSGTKLHVNTRDRNFPSYYKLRSNDSAGNISACLASDFSNFNDTKDPANKMLFNRTEATRMTGDRFYSEVALYPAGETDRCREESKPKCSEDFFEPDEKVNFLALTILGLRLLFLKTVVFNILMTLRLWVS